MDKLLKMNNLAVSFHTDLGEVQAVKSASFSIEKGEVLGIVGESGSGKSVATKNILRLGPKNMKVTSGEIIFKDKNILELSIKELQALRGKEISMVFQDSLSALNPVYPVGKKMVELLRRHDKNITKNEAKNRVLELFESVGIVDPIRCFKSYPHELSGGMRQRIMIAMAICCDPDLMIADEPTTALDVTIQAQILHLLRNIQKERGMSLILITHDLGVVAQMCTNVVVMCGGFVVEQGNVRDIFHNPAHPYTQALIASMPRSGGGKMEQYLERTISDNRNKDICPFYGRCKYETELCSHTIPSMQTIEGEHCSLCHLGKETLHV